VRGCGQVLLSCPTNSGQQSCTFPSPPCHRIPTWLLAVVTQPLAAGAHLGIVADIAALVAGSTGQRRHLSCLLLDWWRSASISHDCNSWMCEQRTQREIAEELVCDSIGSCWEVVWRLKYLFSPVIPSPDRREVSTSVPSRWLNNAHALSASVGGLRNGNVPLYFRFFPQLHCSSASASPNYCRRQQR
jgi:hypothetical protein